MAKKLKLAPCPFCGRREAALSLSVPATVLCKACNARGPHAASEKRAADKWNGRKGEADGK